MDLILLIQELQFIEGIIKLAGSKFYNAISLSEFLDVIKGECAVTNDIDRRGLSNIGGAIFHELDDIVISLIMLEIVRLKKKYPNDFELLDFIRRAILDTSYRKHPFLEKPEDLEKKKIKLYYDNGVIATRE